MELKFERDNDQRWYVVLPQYIQAGGEREDLEMVMGADIMLDRFVDNETNEVTLEISLDSVEYPNSLQKLDVETPSGAYYMWNENLRQRMIIWLCDVTAWVFEGKFPDTIYFKRS